MRRIRNGCLQPGAPACPEAVASTKRTTHEQYQHASAARRTARAVPVGVPLELSRKGVAVHAGWTSHMGTTIRRQPPSTSPRIQDKRTGPSV